MKVLSSLENYSSGCRGVLCDLWGVIHNGQQAFPAAIEVLTRLKKEGKFVLLLSNSPRPSKAVARQINDLGVPADVYDVIVTSGDLARKFLMEEAEAKTFFHLGPARDRPTVDGLPNPETRELGSANYILCTGFLENQPLDPLLYEELFKAPTRNKIPFICANPDREVNIGAKKVPCAGALAELYESLGGTVIWLGKPKKVAYEACFDAIKKQTGRAIKPRDLLAIGDNLETDIAGAAKFGIKTVLITEGLYSHWQIGDGEFEALMKKLNVRPDAIMKRLKWK